ncbi:probable methionine--tRNA ligase [Helianthus annuus]|uniref:probable methionine--tRNA ligase n=1 Tax=Helianthus annuus TaxID=4232 RepID=UPI000B8F4324|nr:probable methionine--tRNA ligase [Helianthus annuus]XP_021981962.1 probable methionine--tRNA ligase [Helianthus annuus]
MPLFKEPKDEEVEFFRAKFAGSQADRAIKAEAEANKIAEQMKNSKALLRYCSQDRSTGEKGNSPKLEDHYTTRDLFSIA